MNGKAPGIGIDEIYFAAKIREHATGAVQQTRCVVGHNFEDCISL